MISSIINLKIYMKCLSKMIIHKCCSSLNYFLILMMAQNLQDFLIAISNNRLPRWKMIFTVIVDNSCSCIDRYKTDKLTDRTVIRLTNIFLSPDYWYKLTSNSWYISMSMFNKINVSSVKLDCGFVIKMTTNCFFSPLRTEDKYLC